MIEVFNEYNTSILGVQQVPYEDVIKYGIIKGKNIRDRIYEVSDMVEKPKREEAPTNVAILCRYIITPTIFDFL